MRSIKVSLITYSSELERRLERICKDFQDLDGAFPHKSLPVKIVHRGL